jgi:CMP/dCMP kinase
MRKPFIVAIDGPSGVGKGTVARAVAAELGFRHVDTGAMYRAVALKALRHGLTLDDGKAIEEMVRSSLLEIDGGSVRIDGEEATREIRTPEIDRAAALVARLPGVRAALVQRQRALAEGSGTVMEGRDIGTVVFPDADVKIYLDASHEERARRRANDPAHANSGTAVEEVAIALRARDQSDKTRTASPLAIAPDAAVVDTTSVPIDRVVERVMELVRAKLSAFGPR